MLTLPTVVGAGLLAGSIHALTGPDHLAAVAPLSVAESGHGAWRVGIRWGLGHALGSAALVSLALFLRGFPPPDTVSPWMESAVGLLLVVVGVWGLRTALGRRRHRHRAQPANAPLTPSAHAALGVGLVHGLAGTPHLLTLLPAVALPSGAQVAAYLCGYGAGNLVAMGAFAGLVGLTSAELQSSTSWGHRAALGACSVAATAVGLVWVGI